MFKLAAAVFISLLPFSWPSAFGADATISNPVVFKVVPKGKTYPASYLLASQHWGVGISDLPKSILSLFDQVEVHAFEIDFSYQFLALKRFLTSPTETNFLAVLPEAKDKPSNGMSQEQIDRLISLGVPSPLAHVLRDEDCDAFEQFRYFTTHPNLQSLDGELTLRAKTQKADFVALETEGVREQADKQAVAQGYSSSCRVTNYIKDNKKIGALDAQLNALRSSYAQLTPQDILVGPEINDPSTIFRNQHWTAELTPLLNEKSVFITVGYDHFPGTTGIIAMLRARGFDITPLQ